MFLTIILLAMLGNLLVIVSVLRTKTLRRQKAYYFVVSLALAGNIYENLCSFPFELLISFSNFLDSLVSGVGNKR